MALKDFFSIRKTFFNPRAWLGYDAIKEQNISLWGAIKKLILPAKAERKETFATAMKRLNITEESLKETELTYRAYTWIFTVLAGLMVLFGFYALLHYGSFASLILSFAMTALFAAQAFRFSFWSFQIKFRKLGCTFEEWRQGQPNDKEGPVT